MERNVDIGEIIDIEDRTDNILFIVKTPKKEKIFVPAVDDLIEEIDTEGNVIYMNLPIGLIEIQ